MPKRSDVGDMFKYVYGESEGTNDAVMCLRVLYSREERYQIFRCFSPSHLAASYPSAGSHLAYISETLLLGNTELKLLGVCIQIDPWNCSVSPIQLSRPEMVHESQC